MKKVLVVITSLFLQYGCNNHNEVSDTELQLYEKSLSAIKSENPFLNSCYIVKPSFLIPKLGGSKIYFQERFLLKNSTLNCLLNNNSIKVEPESTAKIQNLSPCEKSEFIVSISNICNDTLLVVVEYKWQQVEVDEISKANEFQNNAWDLYLLKKLELGSFEIVDLISTSKN